MFFGYLDPGTGSMIIQAVLGGLAAVAIFFRVFWHRIVAFFKRSKSGEPEPAKETSS